MRKLLFIAVSVLLCAGIVLILYVRERRNFHHYPERRDWKERAVRAIEKDYSDETIHRVRDGELARPETDFLYVHNRWLTSKAIAFQDGSWMVYRQQCHKADPRIYDIFIGRGSDGKWYFSDAHFCIDALVLGSDEQPESIERFKKAYHLEIFDGRSDDALEPTTRR